jgi:predicted RNase H-like nuclease (RuvC/YqgF family)
VRIVLSVDPGKKSGIALLSFNGENPEIISSGEFLMEDYAEPILKSFLRLSVSGLQSMLRR